MTPHFTIAEAQVTSTGLDNTVAPAHTVAVLNTAYNMEIVRAVLKRLPIKINSWYRSAAVNKKVGGVPTSEHALGQAVDFVCPQFGTPYEICQSLIYHSHVLNYNQLIYEHSWVHISFPPDGVKGKNEVLTLNRNGGYLKGLVK